MHRMTVGMVETTRRKTRFPTIGATIHAKAKPPSNGSPFLTFPKGKERHTISSNSAGMDSLPLGRAGEGLLG